MAEPQKRGPLLPIRRRLAFAAASVLLCALLIEGLLQLLALAIPAVDRTLSNEPLPATIEDEILGHRPNPELAGHDEAGFRNAIRPDRADVVCIGDSQTYGTSAGADEPWPQQLAVLSGVSTYNMAFGGYGPSHYLVLSREATALQPKLVLIGLYAGNDFVETYQMVRERGRLPFLAAGQGAPRLAEGGPAGSYHRAVQEMSEITRKTPEPPSLRERSRLRQLVKASMRALAGDEDDHPGRDERAHAERLWRKRKKAAEDAARPDLLWAHESGSTRTILTAALRLGTLRLDDPLVADGFRMSLLALQTIADESRRRNDVAVVLIPTKELVFYESAHARGHDIPPTLIELARHETELWSAAKARLDELGIEWIDTLPALQAAVRNGVNPYHESTDGHPDADGHLAIARAVADSPALRRLRPGPGLGPYGPSGVHSANASSRPKR